MIQVFGGDCVRELQKADKFQRVVSVLIDSMFILTLCSVVFSVGFFITTGNQISYLGDNEVESTFNFKFELIALLLVYVITVIYLFISYSIGSKQTMGQYFVGIRLSGIEDLSALNKLNRIQCGIWFGGLLTRRDSYGMSFFDKKFATRLVKKSYII